MENKKLILTVWSNGDPSVGIQGDEIEIDLTNWIGSFADEEDKKTILADFKVEIEKLMSDFFDCRAMSMTNDEREGDHGY